LNNLLILYTAKMLFQSDYWVACKYNEKIETILDFLCTDKGIENLVIIDTSQTNSTNDILKDFNHDKQLPCKVVLITEQEVCVYEDSEEPHTKTIYVRNSLDEMSTNLLRTLQPIFAIFV